MGAGLGFEGLPCLLGSPSPLVFKFSLLPPLPRAGVTRLHLGGETKRGLPCPHPLSKEDQVQEESPPSLGH